MTTEGWVAGVDSRRSALFEVSALFILLRGLYAWFSGPSKLYYSTIIYEGPTLG